MDPFLPQLAQVCADPTAETVNCFLATIRGTLLAAYICAPSNGFYHRKHTLAPMLKFFRDRGMYDGDNNPVIDASVKAHSKDRADLMHLIALHGQFRHFIVPFQRITNNTMGSPLLSIVNALTKPLIDGCNMYAILWAGLCAVFATLEPESWLKPDDIPTVSTWFINMTVMDPATMLTRLPLVVQLVGEAIQPSDQSYCNLLQRDFFTRMTHPLTTFLSEMIGFVVKMAQDG